MRLLPLLFLLFFMPAQATTVWKWDADSTAIDIGPISTCDNFGGVTFDSAEKIEGTASARMTFTHNADNIQMGCNGGNINFGGIFNGQWIFYRWWMKLGGPCGATCGAGQFSWGDGIAKAKASRAKHGGDPAFVTPNIGRTGSSIRECPWCSPNPGGSPSWTVSYNFEPASNSAVTNWQEYIVVFKRQSAEGVADGEHYLFVNGTSVGDEQLGVIWTNATSCGGCSTTWVEAWGGMMNRPFQQITGTSIPSGGNLWVDDFQVDVCADTGGGPAAQSCFNSNFGVGDTTPPTRTSHTPRLWNPGE